jgi:hypothetical protein
VALALLSVANMSCLNKVGQQQGACTCHNIKERKKETLYIKKKSVCHLHQRYLLAFL